MLIIVLPPYPLMGTTAVFDNYATQWWYMKIVTLCVSGSDRSNEQSNKINALMVR